MVLPGELKTSSVEDGQALANTVVPRSTRVLTCPLRDCVELRRSVERARAFVHLAIAKIEALRKAKLARTILLTISKRIGSAVRSFAPMRSTGPPQSSLRARYYCCMNHA